jgi:hypothetical protein
MNNVISPYRFTSGYLGFLRIPKDTYGGGSSGREHLPEVTSGPVGQGAESLTPRLDRMQELLHMPSGFPLTSDPVLRKMPTWAAVICSQRMILWRAWT